MKKLVLAVLTAVSFIAFAEGEAPKTETSAPAEASKAAPAPKKEKKKKKHHNPAAHTGNKAQDAGTETGKKAE